MDLNRSACSKQKMARVLKITVVLVICLISLQCRKDKVLCEICANGLKANRSQIRSQFRAVCGP